MDFFSNQINQRASCEGLKRFEKNIYMYNRKRTTFPMGQRLTSSVGRRDLWEQLLLFSDIKGLTVSPRELVGCRLITDLSQVVKKRQIGEREQERLSL